jgi:hypothetical protein
VTCYMWVLALDALKVKAVEEVAPFTRDPA